MRIGVPRERRSGETRVAATPETVKKLIAAGHEILVEGDAGVAASQPDSAFVAAGARIVSARDAFTAELVIKVRPPTAEELSTLKAGTVLVGMLNPHDAEGLQKLAATGAAAFALEAAPRTTRAQSMDVLSSQANIGGYKAVLLAANLYQRFFPMMMTAAGTVKAARVVVLGAGVAGLQAIATAKRLGAVIEASDVRPAVKEQIESLGAKFIDVPYETDEERQIAEGVGGYARPMPESWMKRQSAAVAQRISQADVVITTALIPGRPAPRLIPASAVAAMRLGSVVVDLAAEAGGNCELTEPGEEVVREGVSIVGLTNLPSSMPFHASQLYARNVSALLQHLAPEGELALDFEDEITAGACVARKEEVPA
jgi:NAD(P) transhydrogenase subunit alpha